MGAAMTGIGIADALAASEWVIGAVILAAGVMARAVVTVPEVVWVRDRVTHRRPAKPVTQDKAIQRLIPKRVATDLDPAAGPVTVNHRAMVVPAATVDAGVQGPATAIPATAAVVTPDPVTEGPGIVHPDTAL